MAHRPKFPVPGGFRLQGTDGIRREIKPARFAEFKGMSPQQVFLEKGIITEEFMELYAYAHVNSLMRNKKMRAGDPIVVGWDPRDTQGLFNRAVVRGVRKAGASALVIGTVPTPLVPIFMLYKNAGGGFMVTASHNPKDQNGIKTFRAFRGMKLLPEDDRQLSRTVLETDYAVLKNLPPEGRQSDCREEALEIFRQFSLAPENAWREKPSHSFKDMMLVVDPANGSLSGIAADIFRRAGFGKIIETNARLNGNVNLNSGVADLEGHKTIDGEMILKGSGQFHRHRAVLKLFELGRKHKSQLIEGTRKLCGAVFDADGDRFYRLDYDPFNDCLHVLSGDETAFLQARYLMTRDPKRYKGTFYINTVESDLNTARAAKALGFKPMLTAVGDKWILLRVAVMIIESRIRTLKKLTGKPLPPALKKSWEAVRKHQWLDVSRFQELEENIERLIKKSSAGKNLVADSSVLSAFAVGSEETGHNITPGRLTREDGGSVPVFFGNSLKSALNTFAATAYLLDGKSPRTRYAFLRKPFRPGFKQTLYAYYVRQELFRKDSALWRRVKRSVFAEGKSRGYRVRTLNFAEDPDMLYISYTTAKGGEAAVFVRNSGTENKIGINLRGANRDARNLRAVGDNCIRILLEEMKDTENHYYKLELDVLSQIAEESVPENRLVVEKRACQRLSAEMMKQGLIRMTPKGYQLTGLGKWYITAGPCPVRPGQTKSRA
ncbi:MAG: hypothetical protein V3U37_04085 [Nitrospinaceae bacterium]